jgi:hypothetical protein
MTATVQNTATTNTFDFWRNRTNELAYAMTNLAVTVGSNTATGNAAITGWLTANGVNLQTINAVSIAGNTASFVTSVSAPTINVSTSSINSTVLFVGNSTANATLSVAGSLSMANSTSNLAIAIPNTTQTSTGNYFLNANGSWTTIGALDRMLTISTQTIGAVAHTLDSFAKASYGAAEYTIYVKDNNANNKYVAKFLLLYDGSTSRLSEYGGLQSNSAVGTFAATSNTTSIIFQFTPTSTNTTVSGVRTVL